MRNLESVTRRRWIRLTALVVTIGQIGLIGFAGWVGSPVALALGEIALVLTVGTGLLVSRYLALRRRYRFEVEEHRRASEKEAASDALHDLVGHEITLIAMQAGLLELRTEGAAAEMAGELRTRAEHAVTSLHDSIDVLNARPGPGGDGDDDLEVLIDQYRAAGANIIVHGALPDAGARIRTTAMAVVREALTNAARHASGKPVEVSLTEHQQAVEIAIAVLDAPRTPQGPGGGHGIASLRRRVQGLGGTLQIEHDVRAHTLTARLSLDPTSAATTARAPSSSRPVRRLVREAAIPIAAVLACAVAFYAWATHDAVIEPTDQTALVVGMSRTGAEPLLPTRQAPVQLTRPPEHPTTWKCAVYTNGNFPLGIATLQVCFDADTLARVTDLAAKPLW